MKSNIERQALAHAGENLINTNDQDGMLPAASCSSLVECDVCNQTIVNHDEQIVSEKLIKYQVNNEVHQVCSDKCEIADKSTFNII
jgi:predicted nucleic acid-binding Zn ribbon protein